MTLAADTRLGPYEIQGLIGRGGMGEVYRARDSRLGRDVAIKVLPASFSADEDRLRRFDQEARAASALNHPNILTIYDTGTHEGAPYVVMEFLEGQELRALLAHGAMPIRTALEYARDAAQGLAAAHDRGIVHRDLKPENMVVTHDGRLKILDFGLARLGPGGRDAPAGDTATRHALTDPGAVLGTVGYMAPEQVRGTTADHRADIFSLGVVLYEMLAGTRPFVAESPVEVLNAILKDDPASLVDGNPRISQQLDKIVRRCLEKRPEARFQSAHDLGFALDALTMPTTSTANASRLLPVGPDETAPAAAPWWRRAVAPLAGGLAVLAVVNVAWSRWPSPPPVPTVRFDVVMGEEQATFANFNRHVLAVSPDGTRIAYAGDRVYLRSLSESTPQPVPGSDGAISTTHPVFSSDGRSLVFWTAKDRSLKRITLGGGAVTTLCQVPSGPMGLSWAGEYLYFGDVDAGIKRVSANGGEPVVVAAAKDREKLDTPQLLPDGEWLLFTLGRRGLVSWDEAQAVVQSMRTGERRVVLERATNAWYLRSGHLLFGRGGGIFAVPFDLKTLTVRGEPVGVVEGVRRAAPGTSGAVHFAVSDSGTLAYLSGSTQRPEIQVVWNWRPELDARVPVK